MEPRTPIPHEVREVRYSGNLCMGQEMLPATTERASASLPVDGSEPKWSVWDPRAPAESQRVLSPVSPNQGRSGCSLNLTAGDDTKPSSIAHAFGSEHRNRQNQENREGLG